VPIRTVTASARPPRQIRCIGTAIPPGVMVGGYDDGAPVVIELDDEEMDILLLDL
jgi:hypothetical protein